MLHSSEPSVLQLRRISLRHGLKLGSGTGVPLSFVTVFREGRSCSVASPQRSVSSVFLVNANDCNASTKYQVSGFQFHGQCRLSC